MDSDRILKLKDILEKDPADSFTMYALGLEYASGLQYEDAREIFEELLRTDPHYLGTYYQLGKVYESLEDTATAKRIYEKGIFVATSQNDNHTKSELEQAIDELL